MLGWKGESRRDDVRCVDEESSGDLADSGLGGVFGTEGLGLVLINVGGGGDATTLNGFCTSKFCKHLQSLIGAGGGSRNEFADSD